MYLFAFLNPDIGLKESNAAMIKGQAVAGEAMKTEDLYGKATQPSSLCGASSLGGGLQLGARATTQVRSTMREKQLEYANREGAKPVEYLSRVLDEEHPDEQAMVDSLFPLPDAHERSDRQGHERLYSRMVGAQQ